jgi:hypothetical protein
MTRDERRRKALRAGERAKEAVYDAFAEAAEMNAVCPSRLALMVQLGVCREAIEMAQTLLEQEGRIAVESKPGTMRVKAVASGQWTAWNGGGGRNKQGMLITRRRCLSCLKWFDSWGRGNRRCRTCKKHPPDDGIDCLGQPAIYS